MKVKQLPISDPSNLGQKILELYSESRAIIEAKTEGKDVEKTVFIPIAHASFGSELKLESTETTDDEIRKQLESGSPQYSQLEPDDKERKQIDAFATKVVERRRHWLRDALLASGLIDPSYSILGRIGIAFPGKVTLAKDFQPKHYLYVFDTNVFARHLISNYLRLRLSQSTMKDILVATPPAVIWELEEIANRRVDEEETRIARSAFRDVAYMESSMKVQLIPAKGADTETVLSDRLIRRQVREFKWNPLAVLKTEEVSTEAKVFVTFDRVSALAAQAEGLVCCSLDVPVEQGSWTLNPVDAQSREDALGSFFAELSVLRGTIRVRSGAKPEFYVLGDWPGKANHEWIKGQIRHEVGTLGAR